MTQNVLNICRSANIHLRQSVPYDIYSLFKQLKLLSWLSSSPGWLTSYLSTDCKSSECRCAECSCAACPESSPNDYVQPILHAVTTLAASSFTATYKFVFDTSQTVYKSLAVLLTRILFKCRWGNAWWASPTWTSHPILHWSPNQWQQQSNSYPTTPNNPNRNKYPHKKQAFKWTTNEAQQWL